LVSTDFFFLEQRRRAACHFINKGKTYKNGMARKKLPNTPHSHYATAKGKSTCHTRPLRAWSKRPQHKLLKSRSTGKSYTLNSVSSGSVDLKLADPCHTSDA